MHMVPVDAVTSDQLVAQSWASDQINACLHKVTKQAFHPPGCR